MGRPVLARPHSMQLLVDHVLNRADCHAVLSVRGAYAPISYVADQLELPRTHVHLYRRIGLTDELAVKFARRLRVRPSVIWPYWDHPSHIDTTKET